MLITKTNFISYCDDQAGFNSKGFTKGEASIEDQISMEIGREVGILGRQLFPDGINIREGKMHNIKSLAENTACAIAAGERKLYEAAFMATYKNMVLYAQVDILTISDKRTIVTEVKSSLIIKHPHHILDIAFQYYIMNANGFNNLEIYLAYPNKDYVRTGNFDLNKYFIWKNMTVDAKKAQFEIERMLAQMSDDLKTKSYETSTLIA